MCISIRRRHIGIFALDLLLLTPTNPNENSLRKAARMMTAKSSTVRLLKISWAYLVRKHLLKLSFAWSFSPYLLNGSPTSIVISISIQIII